MALFAIPVGRRGGGVRPYESAQQAWPIEPRFRSQTHFDTAGSLYVYLTFPSYWRIRSAAGLPSV